MSLLGLFELARFSVAAYSDPARKQHVEDFEVQYNPASLSMRYASALDQPPVASGNSKPQWRYNESGRLSVTLVFDGTNVGDMGVVSLFGSPKTVEERISNFLRCCASVEAAAHETPFLRLTWSTKLAWSAQPGAKEFDCRLASADIHYKAFGRDGAPLHAEIAAVFVEDVDGEKAAAAAALQSPDLTHRRLVKSGDTLPLLCREMYGSTQHYLRVAEFNRLDDFRVLEPGTVLTFPPYEKKGK